MDICKIDKMKLYSAPGACSMAAHIALIETGVDFEIESVELFADSTTTDYCHFSDINPKGFVPVLEISPNVFLTENIAVLQFIADRNPASKLAPAPDSMARYRLQEWLGFINSDIHRSFTPLFRATTPEGTIVLHRAKIATYLDYLESELSNSHYLMGGDFTVADCYLFTVLNWSDAVGISLKRWPRITAYCNSIASRDSVKAALKWGK